MNGELIVLLAIVLAVLTIHAERRGGKNSTRDGIVRSWHLEGSFTTSHAGLDKRHAVALVEIDGETYRGKVRPGERELLPGERVIIDTYQGLFRPGHFYVKEVIRPAVAGA